MTANRRIPAIAGAAALLLIVIWYFLLWAPEAKSLRAAHTAHAAAVHQIAQLDAQKAGLNALVKQIPADNARFAQLEAALPDNPQLDQALNLLHQAAASAGVSISSLQPTAPATGSASAISQGGPSIAISMSVSGAPEQVKAFLSSLSTLSRTVVVDKAAIASGTGASASISARIFYAGQPTP